MTIFDKIGPNCRTVIQNPMPPPIRIAVFAFEGVSLFHLSVPGIVFAWEPGTRGLPLYEVFYCAHAPGRIHSDQGIGIDVPLGLEAMETADIVIVPAWSHPGQATPVAVTQALQRASARGAQVVGLCLGAFVLGDAGLLDGRSSTTHWAFRELFLQRFPKTDFHPDVLYVDDGNVVTSAGTVAAIDCCLNLVRQRQGAEVANQVARKLVTPAHRPGGQAQYIEKPVPSLPSEHRLPGVLEWAREHLSQPLTVDALAGVARMSRRTFTRRFRESTGTTVVRWLASERVARAQQLLETTDLPIEQVAVQAGYGSALSLRQNFAAQVLTSPSAYRQAFRKGRAQEGPRQP